MAAPQKLTPAKQKQVVKAYVAGKALSDIREKFGVSYGTIRSIVRRAGETLRPVGRPRKAA